MQQRYLSTCLFILCGSRGIMINKPVTKAISKCSKEKRALLNFIDTICHTTDTSRIG